MSDSQWHYVQAGTQHGPVGTEQIRALLASRAIDRETLVWSPSLSGWQPLGQTELATLAAGGPPPMSAPSYAPAQPAFPTAPAPGMAYGAAPAGAYPGAAGSYPGGTDYGVYPGLVDAVKICFSKFVTWKGRATRSEYWYFVLAYVIAITVAITLDVMLLGGTTTSNLDTSGGVNVSFNATGSLFSSLTGLVFFLPLLSVLVRRLHDTDRSGWWYWIILIPFVGAILLLVWMCSRGTPGPNRFG